MTLLKKLNGSQELAIVKIKAGGNSSGCLEAYAMDEDCIKNKKDKSIRKKVGNMEKCYSCDYFYLVETEKKELRGYIIEETDLGITISDKKEEFIKNNKTGLHDNFLSERVRDYLVSENIYKIYSSLLMMCKLCNQFTAKDKLWQNIEFYFVLLATHEKSTLGKNAAIYKKFYNRIRKNIKKMPINLEKNQLVFSYKGFKDHINSL